MLHCKPVLLTDLDIRHIPVLYLQASFLGHSAPGAGSKVQRGGSGEHTNGCRSFIFGSRDDSNSEAQQPAEVPLFHASSMEGSLLKWCRIVGCRGPGDI